MKWENPRKSQITADKDAEIFNEAPVVLMSCFLNALPHLSIQRVSKQQHVPGSSSLLPKTRGLTSVHSLGRTTKITGCCSLRSKNRDYIKSEKPEIN